MKFFLLSIFLYISVVANEHITLQLQWLHQFQFAGFYVAKEKGFYNDVHLDVTIKEYNSSINVVKDVISNEGYYGVGRSSLILDYND